MSDKKKIALFSADNHLSDASYRSRPRLQYDSRKGFVSLIDAANTLDVPLVLGGDLFDRREQEPAILEFAIEQIARLKNPCYLTDGNHDSWGPDDPRSWAYRIGARRLNDLTTNVMINGVAFAGLASTRNDLQMRLTATNPGTRVLILHQLVDVFCKKDTMHNLLAEWIPPVDMCLIGDYHVRTTATVNQRTVLHSPGSTVLNSISESCVKRATLITEDDAQVLGLEDVELAWRPKLEYEVKTQEELEQLIEALPEEIREVSAGAPMDSFKYPVVRVDIAASLGGARDRLVQAVGAADFLWVYPHADASVEADLRAATETSDHEAIVNAIVDRMTVSDEFRPEVRRAALALLSRDVTSVFEEIKTSFGINTK